MNLKKNLDNFPALLTEFTIGLDGLCPQAFLNLESEYFPDIGLACELEDQGRL